MASTLLIDVGPAVGSHGQRGIGRYVRGLAASIATFPEDLIARIWAIGFPGPTLDSFGARAVRFSAHRWLARLPTWATGRLATNAAVEKCSASVLHATDPQRPWGHPAVSSIVTVYDLIPLREREMLRSWRLDHRLIYRWYIRQIKSASRILAISRTTAEDLQELLGIGRDRIDIVYPAVAPPATLRRTEPSEPTFLCVGALDAHKQPELALRAFADYRTRFGSGSLRYIGPSDHAQTHRLYDLAKRLGVAESVAVDGWISDGDLEAAYGAATALISTSRLEGFGLPPVEALLRGVPVVAVDTAVARETLTGVASIVPSDVGAIASAMAHPTNPPAHAITAIRERFSIANVARSLEDSYRRVLD